MEPQRRAKKTAEPPAPVTIEIPVGSIGPGKRVTLEYQGQPLDITLVHPDTAKDAKMITEGSQKQSVDSKLARAILGHKVGDTVIMEINKKKEPIKILTINEGHIRPVKGESAEAVFGETEDSQNKE
jgi:transcription elongation GreA/GreB family factor